MATAKTEVLESHARHIGSAMLVVNGDGSWSVGTTLANAVKVRYGDIASIDDSTFGWSAVAAESNGSGGCSCDLDGNAPGWSVLGVFAAVALRRRRR